jgi:hypothetical protein
VLPCGPAAVRGSLNLRGARTVPGRWLLGRWPLKQRALGQVHPQHVTRRPSCCSGKMLAGCSVTAILKTPTLVDDKGAWRGPVKEYLRFEQAFRKGLARMARASVDSTSGGATSPAAPPQRNFCSPQACSCRSERLTLLRKGGMSHLPEVANPDCGFFLNFSTDCGCVSAKRFLRCTVVRRKHAGTNVQWIFLGMRVHT